MFPILRLPAARIALLALAATGCTAPRTLLENPHGHRVFVDGAAVRASVLPFRYYGTSRWDALPADAPRGEPDWNLQPASEAIELPPPASPWLFPLDLPLEALRRVVHGREDVSVTILLPPTPPGDRSGAEVPPTGQARLAARAVAARIAR